MDGAHTTCYFDTFLTVAPDSTARGGVEPPKAANPSVAWRTWERIIAAPYQFTSDDVLFGVWADRTGIPEDERDVERAEFFAKPRACLRASDLGKKYGWGIHHDADGRIALYAVESADYAAFAAGTSPRTGEPVTVKPAMRSKRR